MQSPLDKSWKDQELANTAWAMSTMGRRPVKLLRLIAEAVLADDASQYHPQGIANLAWAFASLDFGMARGEEELKAIRDRMFLVRASREACGPALEAMNHGG